jgi:hypothetical protein
VREFLQTTGIVADWKLEGKFGVSPVSAMLNTLLVAEMPLAKARGASWPTF